jgi:ribosomal protein L9
MMSNTIVTPAQVEARLYSLSKDLDAIQKELEEQEENYYMTKAHYEVALAKSRMNYAAKSSPTGKNYTVQEREDMALIENQDLHFQLAQAEAMVKAGRANASRIKTQVDITRSIGTSVRVSMEVV